MGKQASHMQHNKPGYFICLKLLVCLFYTMHISAVQIKASTEQISIRISYCIEQQKYGWRRVTVRP